MTELLIAASVGLWFIGLSLGLSNSHKRWSLVSSFLYVRKSARVAVVEGIGRCGLIGTCCMTGVLAVSRTGVLVNFDQGVQGYQINILASMVPVEALQLASCFFGVLLGIRPELVEQPLFHDATVDHDVSCGWKYVFDDPLEVCDDGL